MKFAISKSTICNEVKGSLASHCNSGLVYHVQSLSLPSGAYVLSVLRQNREAKSCVLQPFYWQVTDHQFGKEWTHIFKNFFSSEDLYQYKQFRSKLSYLENACNSSRLLFEKNVRKIFGTYAFFLFYEVLLYVRETVLKTTTTTVSPF